MAFVPNALSVDTPGNGDFFVTLKDGRVWCYRFNGTSHSRQTSFSLTVSNVYSAGPETGLFGIAFSPNWGTDRWCYFYHTQNSPRENVVVRYQINRDPSTGNYSAVTSRRQLVLGGITTNSMYHNGGHLGFDSLGNLMISTGDAQNQANGQSLTTLNGKILRIKPNATTAGYTIPAGNPFGNDASRKREIWCWGLRNPWSMDQEQHTTRFYIGDVGSSTWEEINDGTTPANFGWNVHEGPVSNSSLQNYRNPVYAYNHGSGRASITGPVFYHYHGFKWPSKYEGTALFSDYVLGRINVLLGDNRTVETIIDTGLRYPEGPICLATWEGDLYMICLDASIRKLTFS
jgi:glucose/arabinose dehydrogenase